VILTTFVGLYMTGRESLTADGASNVSLSDIIGASDPFTVLLWASLTGLTAAIVLAVGQSALTIRESLEAMINGFKSMLMAFVVLTLAWSLGQVCNDLATADFIKGAVGPHVPPGLLPMVIFLVAAAVSFATGTSWGTMAILTPLAIPLVFHASEADPLALSATVSAILGGAVFGDHCSPISDTTILSSMADPVALRPSRRRDCGRCRLPARGIRRHLAVAAAGCRFRRDRRVDPIRRSTGGVNLFGGWVRGGAPRLERELKSWFFESATVIWSLRGQLHPPF
jgi:hypothetical protein